MDCVLLFFFYLSKKKKKCVWHIAKLCNSYNFRNSLIYSKSLCPVIVTEEQGVARYKARESQKPDSVSLMSTLVKESGP